MGEVVVAIDGGGGGDGERYRRIVFVDLCDEGFFDEFVRAISMTLSLVQSRRCVGREKGGQAIGR